MRTLLLSTLLLITTIKINAQACEGPGREPTTAQSVCGAITFIENNVKNCTGPDLPNPTSGCGQVTTDNSRWYKFHCFQAGTFGFLLTPNSPADDYDWEILDITGFAPSDIYFRELRVSLNLSGQTGITGCTAAGVSDINCGGGNPGTQFNRLLNLQVGHDYLMMVNNWSGSNVPYTIDFSGTAVLTDNAIPSITDVGIVGCDATKLKVTFSEDILCSSIDANGGEFTITTGTHTILGVASDCFIGANGVPYLIINLQSPIPAGSYQLNVANSPADGNTFENVCKVLVPAGATPFTITYVAAAPVIQSVVVDDCHRDIVIVNFDKPVDCTTLTAAGSEMTISPGTWPINFITYSCTNNQYTTQVILHLADYLPGSTYGMRINNSPIDGNTLSDTCGVFIPDGYTKQFTVGQPAHPLMQSFDYDNCHRNTLVVHFDKPVDCASIALDGSDFLFTPGGPMITGVITDCGTATYTSQITLLLSNQMPPLQFLNVMIRKGSDGNTLSDTCRSFIPEFFTKAFQAPALPPAPVIDSVQFDKCNLTSMKLFYSKPIVCSSIIPSGVQFFANGPTGGATIVSATGDAATCAQGYTNTIVLQFATPITVGGIYAVGSWYIGNSIYDTCRISPTVGQTAIQVTVPGKPSAVFSSQVQWGCGTDTIILSNPGGNSINSWRWTFSDGTTATGQTVTKLYPVVTATIDVELIVSNGFCSDTTMQTITLGNFFKAAFTNTPDTFCINTPVSFTDASTGTITNYLWDFGDLSQFNGQNPPDHSYPVSNNYDVKLIVTDDHGCKDTASKVLRVTALAVIDFTGLKPQYCTGNQVLLKRQISPNVISYVWDNGDGKTFTNEVDVSFSYANEGAYTISLTAEDKYCGPASISKTVAVYAVPKVKLGADTVLCGSEQMLIGVAPEPNYSYLWNTGETTSQILTWAFFNRDYSLTVDNHGCRAVDAMYVKVLPFCLIKVPNAFTPNGDGLNDELKALNADLAKDFTFQVYNRLGQLIFTTNNPLNGWDGNIKGVRAETGTFVWILTYIDPWTGKPVKEKGTSILIR